MTRTMQTLAVKPPTFAFLIRHPAHLIALGFGTGLSPIAPGTFGTLVALPIAWLLHARGGSVGWIVAIVATVIVGTWCAHVTSRDLGVVDHASIVVDEIAAFLVVLFFVGIEPARVAVAFVLFRVFDIWKPPPIRQIDRATQNGIGVMADDLAAAGYTLLVVAVGERLLGR